MLPRPAPLSFDKICPMLCPPTMPASPFSVPLPKSWPKHAKAATLHIISLAHFVLTHGRGLAGNSPIHRVRLAAEQDRLDSEVALLREEIRIKDAACPLWRRTDAPTTRPPNAWPSSN